MKWEKVEIGQLGDVITGNTPPRKNPELYGDFVPFIKPTDIDIDRRYTPNPEECYSELGYERYRKSLIPKGATCVVTIGSIGKKITQAIADCFINQAVNAVIPNENYDADFVFYLLKNNLDKVKGLDSGTSSGRENVSKSSFSSIEVKVIKHLPTQRKIASILSAYDDLIENNLKRIKLLEEKAFLRYKQIVREEKMERKVSVYDYAEIMSGGTPSTTNPNYWEGSIPFFTPKDLSTQSGYYLDDTERKITELGLEKCNSRLFSKDTIFITARGTVGKLVLAKIPSAISQSNYALTTRDKSSNYFLFLALIDKISHFKQLAVGGVFDTIIVDTFKMIFLELPDKNTINEFNIEIKPIFQFIDILQKQNAKLREARDILLPKLMNGQIEV